MQHIQRKNNVEVLSILKNVDPCQLTNSLGNTLLHYAAKYGNNEFARHLIDLGAAVDAPNRRHRTPLFFAVDGGQEDTALLLVEAKSDIFQRGVSGQCPLTRAFQYKPHIGTVLLGTVTIDSLKKNIEYVNREHARPYCGLHQFVLLKNVDITRILLESGSPVDSKSPQCKDTALHLAAEQLDLEHVKLLLEFNASVNAKGRYGQTPMARILIKKKDEEHDKALEILKVLIAAGAMLIDRESQEPMVLKLLSAGNRKVIRFVLQDQVDLQYADDHMWPALFALATNREPEVLAEVPNLGSAVKVSNCHGATMLHIAAMTRNVNAVKPLLDNGADVDAEDKEGETPLDWVIGTYARFEKYDDLFYDFLNFIEVPLERGARPRLIVDTLFMVEWIGIMKDKYVALQEPMLAYLGIREAFGRTIDGSSYNNMESYSQLKLIFDSMRQQVDELKRVRVWHSVT